ncbi:hypothetical protein ACFL1A_00715 [Patescibacteria group bacterium]
MAQVEQEDFTPSAEWMSGGNSSILVESGDELPFLIESDTGHIFASLHDSTRVYFRSLSESAGYFYTEELKDWFYDVEYFKSLLDLSILMTKPNWDRNSLEKLGISSEVEGMDFVGIGMGGAFRAAFNMPENLAAVARIRERVLDEEIDFLDVDVKLPMKSSEFKGWLKEKLLPKFIGIISGSVYEQIEIAKDEFDKGLIFKGSIANAGLSDVPERIITVTHIKLGEKEVLELEFTDARDEKRLPPMTIHVTDFDVTNSGNIRWGEQMPLSMNMYAPIYFNHDAEDLFAHFTNGRSINTQEWLILTQTQYKRMLESF